MRGDRLRKLRNEKKIGQAELANILGISPSAIGMYERNNRDPDDELKLKIADFFGVSIDYLLGKTDIRNETTEINIDDVDIAFFNGFKDLQEEDKEVMRSTLEAFLKKNKKK